MLCDPIGTTTNHASISLFELLQQVPVLFCESYLPMDMWKEQMSQKHDCNMQCKLDHIEATRWWSKHKCLRKIFGTFEDSSKGTYCDVVQIFHAASRSKKPNIKAQFDAKIILNNMIRHQYILTAMTYLRIMEKTSAISKYLRTSGLDIINAFNVAVATTNDMKQICRNFSMVVNHL